jgi:hypothetical protein
VFNLQPGTGLGFTGSKQIALGLGTPYTVIVIVVTPDVEEEPTRQGSPGGAGRYAGVVDYGYREAAQRAKITRRIIRDDNEVIEIIIIALESGFME